MSPAGPGVEAVVFDWGGTLTRWHDVDFHAESLALAQAVVDADARAARRAPGACTRPARRSGDARATHQQSATVDDLFAEAGLRHDPALLAAYYDFWAPHTAHRPRGGPALRGPARPGIRVGVLSNTIWPRSFHEAIFERDGVRHLIDGDVYTSESETSERLGSYFVGLGVLR